jgi:hypothetical protein
MKLTSILFVCCVAVWQSFGQPIPPEVKSIVAFIFVPDTTGKLVPNGTAFFVGVKDTNKPPGYAVNLVTAKHILQLEDRKTFYPVVFVRLNRKAGDAEILRLDLQPAGNSKNVFVHSDPTVDIAVVPALPDENVFDFKFISDDFLTTGEDFQTLKIREGSEIFFTGLFIPHIGERKNYPVVRFGRVALVTDERINWEGTKTQLYLVESASYGGNSGSPVFFYLGAEREPGSIVVGAPVLKLAGIMKGFVGERRPIELVETARIPVSVSNIGIAGVVPAYLLHEILFGPELKAKRGF